MTPLTGSAHCAGTVTTSQLQYCQLPKNVVSMNETQDQVKQFWIGPAMQPSILCGVYDDVTMVTGK